MAFVPFTDHGNAKPFYGCCPDCGRSFSLIDLAVMAQGDGWTRTISLGYDPELMRGYHPTFREFGVLGNPSDLAARSDFSLSAVMRRLPDGSFELIVKPAADKVAE